MSNLSKAMSNLHFLKQSLFTTCFQIAIVITDGEQTTNRGAYTALSEAARGLKNKNVRVFSLGIGARVDEKQLNDIASSPDNVLTATSFSDLSPAAKTIVRSSCPGRFCLKRWPL